MWWNNREDKGREKSVNRWKLDCRLHAWNHEFPAPPVTRATTFVSCFFLRWSIFSLLSPKKGIKNSQEVTTLLRITQRVFYLRGGGFGTSFQMCRKSPSDKTRKHTKNMFGTITNVVLLLGKALKKKLCTCFWKRSCFCNACSSRRGGLGERKKKKKRRDVEFRFASTEVDVVGRRPSIRPTRWAEFQVETGSALTVFVVASIYFAKGGDWRKCDVFLIDAAERWTVLAKYSLLGSLWSIFHLLFCHWLFEEEKRDRKGIE